jgi:hypothetical protein
MLRLFGTASLNILGVEEWGGGYLKGFEVDLSPQKRIGGLPSYLMSAQIRLAR